MPKLNIREKKVNRPKLYPSTYAPRPGEKLSLERWLDRKKQLDANWPAREGMRGPRQ
jgi:hypothetical protein